MMAVGHKETGGGQVPVRSCSECGPPAEVPTGRRWEGEGDQGGEAGPGMVPGVSKQIVSFPLT